MVWEVRLEDILDNGTKTGTMMYFINVTVLVRQSEQLRTVNEERVRFMAKASHELRSPLNVILGADEMLLREIRDPSVREYAELIREEVGGMVNLVEDIINSSLAEQEMLSIKEESFSLKESLVHLCNIYKRKAEAKNLSFTFFWDGESVDKHPDLMLSGDRNRIKQILINLLENAIKYTEKGEIKLVVTEKNHADGKYLIEFIVSDTGTGIPEAEQNAVFEKYKRGQEAEASGKEGLGLGLSIVKGFVEAMGGNIHLESHSGIGSNFIVLLPLKEAEFSGNEKVFEDEKSEIGTAAFSGGKRILAVDDRPRNILVMQRLLKDSGISVDRADCGADAADLCRKVSYDALIIDFMMPGMDGIETLKAIRSDPDGKNTDTYAIVFSANVTPDAEKMYREAGFSDFLPKPVYFDDLIQTLKKAFYKTGDSAGAEHKSADEGEGVQILRRLRDAGVDTEAGIAYSDDDRDFYLELLGSFSESYTQDLEELQKAYGAILEGSGQLPNGLDSWKEFTRLAHGIKGELRAFGDSQGAELFYTLEKAGKAEKRENLEETYAQAVSHLDYLVKIIQGDCGDGNGK